MKKVPVFHREGGDFSEMHLVVVAALAAPMGRMRMCLRGPNTYLRYTQSPHPLLLKQALAGLAARTNGGAAATDTDAAEAEVLIQLLEARGKKAPSWEARGPLIKGSWDQAYTDNPNAGTTKATGGMARRRLVGPFSGRVQQLIVYEEPFGREIPAKFTYSQRARGSWRSLGLQAELRTSVEPKPDAETWEVRFESMTWSLLNGRLRLRERPLPPGAGGVWRTTYLDHDTRVLRAQSSRGGRPTTYVLRKSS